MAGHEHWQPGCQHAPSLYETLPLCPPIHVDLGRASGSFSNRIPSPAQTRQYSTSPAAPGAVDPASPANANTFAVRPLLGIDLNFSHGWAVARVRLKPSTEAHP